MPINYAIGMVFRETIASLVCQYMEQRFNWSKFWYRYDQEKSCYLIITDNDGINNGEMVEAIKGFIAGFKEGLVR